MEFNDESGWLSIKVAAYSAEKNKVIALTISLNLLINPSEVSDTVKAFWSFNGEGN